MNEDSAFETETDVSAGDERPSSERISGYLRRLDERQRAVRRGRLVTLGVGAVVAGVAYLTSIGVASVETRELVTSAGAIAAGFALTKA